MAAIFDAFLSIYKTRIADLLRIATGGTGRLPEGQMPNDLVNRLANEAAKSARHVLTMCIRALDYCPPVDLTYGDYLRALITADFDLVRDDNRGYRVAVIEAFRRRGIYPRDVRVLSEESLRWNEPTPAEQKQLAALIPDRENLLKMAPLWDLGSDRTAVFKTIKESERLLQQYMNQCGPNASEALRQIGLDPDLDDGRFEVHSARPARRIGPDGRQIVELVVEITQRRPVFLDIDPADVQSAWKRCNQREDKDADFWFRGGCTLLIDPVKGVVRYVIRKRIDDGARLRRQVAFVGATGRSPRSNYFGTPRRLEESEAFAMLHRGQMGEDSVE